MILKICEITIGANPIEGSSSSSTAAVPSAADREHLLLAAGQRAADLMAPLGQPRKGLEHPVQPLLVLGLRRELARSNPFRGSQPRSCWKHAAALRRLDEALDDPVRLDLADVGAFEPQIPPSAAAAPRSPAWSWSCPRRWASNATSSPS